MERYISSSISEKYNKTLSMICKLKLLILFDNCEEMVAHEEKAFYNFINDLCQKMQNSSIIVSSTAHLATFSNLGCHTYTLTKLSNEQVYELLSEKVKSKDTLMQELFSIQMRKNRNSEKNKLPKEINFNHEFFKMLNGHPHSVLLIASLRNDIGLEAIYKKLRKIRKHANLDLNNMSEFIFALNVETSLEFVRKQNLDAYKILLCFALSPCGLAWKDCYRMCRNWDLNQQFLINRALVKPIQNLDLAPSETVSSKPGYKPRIEPIKKYKMYMMDQALLRTVQMGMNEKELDEADKKVVEILVNKLQKLYSNFENHDSVVALTREDSTQAAQKLLELREFEGNVWAATSRMEEKAARTGLYSRQITGLTDNSNVMRQSFAVRKGLAGFLKNKMLGENNELLNSQNNIKRKGTYILKQRDMFENCFGSNTDHKNYGEGLQSNMEKSESATLNSKKKSILQKVAKLFYQEMNRENDTTEEKNVKKDNLVKKFVYKLKDRIHKKIINEVDEHMEDSTRHMNIIRDWNEIEESDKDSSSSSDVDETPHIRAGITPKINISSAWDKIEDDSFCSDSGMESASPEKISHNKMEESKVATSNLLNEAAKRLELRSKTINFSKDIHKELVKEPKKSVFKLNMHDQMVVLFSVVLLQCNRHEAAIKVLEETGLGCSSFRLTHGNALRYIALTMTSLNDTSLYNALGFCERAHEKFTQVNSILGCAVTLLLEIIILSKLINIEEDDIEE